MTFAHCLVHYRIGSLEKQRLMFAGSRSVHCRTGSLEKSQPTEKEEHMVHYRTGSLETTTYSVSGFATRKLLLPGSLPTTAI